MVAEKFQTLVAVAALDTLDDIFELQDRMSESIVGAIAPQLERAEIERAGWQVAYDGMEVAF